MQYYVAQAFGILTTVVCLVMPMMKYKWQMLVCNALSNLFAGANILLLGQVGALPVYIIAILQVFVTLWHLWKNTSIRKWENVLFLILYLSCGLAGFQKPLDLLPTVGAMFNMLATFQLDAQRSRMFLLVNASVFTLYYLLLGSTSIFSTLITVASTAAALYRYRKK